MKTLTATEVAERHNATVTKGHNSNGQLKSYVERFEKLAEQRGELAEDTRELAKEAKGNGFDVAAIKKIVKERAEDTTKREKRETLDAVVDTYKNALGMLS